MKHDKPLPPIPKRGLLLLGIGIADVLIAFALPYLVSHEGEVLGKNGGLPFDGECCLTPLWRVAQTLMFVWVAPALLLAALYVLYPWLKSWFLYRR